MTVLRWKLDKNSSGAKNQLPTIPRDDQPRRPATLAFVNIESPTQLTDPEKLRKVRRHVVANLKEAQRRQAQMLNENGGGDDKLHRSSMTKTYLESVGLWHHLQQILRALGVADAGALQLALDATTTDFSSAHTPGEDVPDSSLEMRRYTRSLGTVRARILHGRSRQDRNQALATAICLAIFDLRIGNFQRWAVHMEGVRRIADEAGGLEALDVLDSFQTLREALYIADVLGSLIFNTWPRFRQHTTVSLVYTPPTMFINPKMLQEKSCALSPIALALGGELADGLRSLSQLSERISQAPPTALMQHSTELSRELFPLLHDLLILPALRPDEPATPATRTPVQAWEWAAMREAVRQAELAAVSCVLSTSSRDDTYCARRRNGKIRQLLLRAGPDVWEGLEGLKLWVLVVGALIEDAVDRAWLMGQLAATMLSLRLESWSSLVVVLRSIAWSDALAVVDAATVRVDVERELCAQRLSSH